MPRHNPEASTTRFITTIIIAPVPTTTPFSAQTASAAAAATATRLLFLLRSGFCPRLGLQGTCAAPLWLFERPRLAS